ncbi:MAG TPA: hypothetical protein VMT05_03655 [Terriglobales bacterium]|jgi:hypothetical protein|nr:hypothetical protein [Terriglobales bacterium]
MSPNQPEISEEKAFNPGVSYEPSQADLRVVLGFLLALALASVMVLFVLWGMFGYFRSRSAERGPLPSPRMYTSPPSVPQPQLQPDPVADYNEYRLSAGQTLNSYGWVDQKAGTVRIPIDRAMDLVAERGLPWQAPGTGLAPTAPNPNPATGPMPGATRAQEDLNKTRK